MRALGVLVALLVGCGSSGGDWVKQDVPMPQFLSVYTVWAAGDNDVWLGGSSLWHFDGESWTETPPPVPTGIVDFFGFTPSDIWAIGGENVFHWDGATWSEVPATAGVTMTAMWRIWASSSTDVWIGNQDNSRVYHYNGTTWSVTTLQFVMVDALWGSSTNDIWLTGLTDMYRYNGSTWERQDSSSTPSGGNDIWGSGPDDVWVADGFDSLTHWDGSTWTPEEDNFEDYNGLWGSASNDIYAVGNRGIVSHFDGSSWSTSTQLGMRENFTMVHGSSPTNIWATGVNVSEQKAFVLHYEP